MEQKAKINGTQLSVLLFISVTSTIIIYVPGYTAKEAKESAWLAASIVPLAFGYLTLILANNLGSKFPDLTIFQYCATIMGKPVGKCIGVGYLLYLLGMEILIAREFSDFLGVTTLPLTPRIWLLICIIALAMYGAYKGLEVIARASQFILGIYLLGFTVAILGALSNFQVGHLLPIMEDGLMPILRGSIAPASWYGEMCLLTMIFPFVNKPMESKKKASKALIAVTLFVTIDVVVTVGVLGSNLAGELSLPFWSMARSIELGEVVQRLESFLLVFWITGIIIKEAFLNYLILLGLTQVFGFKRTNVVLGLTAGFEVFIAHVILGNTSQVDKILRDFWPYFRITFELCVPVFLLVSLKLRNKFWGGF